MPPSHESAPRREFLRDAVRYSVLAGLGALAASAVARRGPFAGSVCPGSGECLRCTLASGCARPRTTGPNPKPLPTQRPS